ncbi:MAG: hypothetical protein IPK93_04725 [Solirubrobacterales bacterium]|nr:hypothetical protein [Solirubrobacterales bacterium]
MAENLPQPILNAENIFLALDNFGVEYVLIGGIAVQTHGHVRMTNDADLIPAPNPGNLERLAGALKSLDARVLNPGHEDEEITGAMLPRSTVWQFTTREGGVDVMHEVPGGREYPDLADDVLRVRLGELEVPVVGLEDLIRMKLARGRELDWKMSPR